jgi:hypothetical protein
MSVLSLQQLNLKVPLVVPALNSVAPLHLRDAAEPVQSNDDVETELYIGLPGRDRCSNWQSG